MHFNIWITSWLFWVYMSLTTFSWGLYKTSIIESNLKSNLSVVFILMFCWVSTTAAVTTVWPLKQSKHKSTHYLQFPWYPADVVICPIWSLLFCEKKKKSAYKNKYRTSKYLLLAGPAEPCESLFDTESEEEAAVVDGRAGGGTVSDFSDRFSLKVPSTTVMSDWLRISCVGKKTLMNINLV